MARSRQAAKRGESERFAQKAPYPRTPPAVSDETRAARQPDPEMDARREPMRERRQSKARAAVSCRVIVMDTGGPRGPHRCFAYEGVSPGAGPGQERRHGRTCLRLLARPDPADIA